MTKNFFSYLFFLIILFYNKKKKKKKKEKEKEKSFHLLYMCSNFHGINCFEEAYAF